MKPNISKILKELRKHNGKTQQEIANVLGITRQAYSRYESNIREPGLESLVKLADYYGVSEQIFFMGDIEKPIDPNMDIVELSALYQAKQLTSQKSTVVKSLDESVDSEENISKAKSMLFSKLGVQPNIEDRNPYSKKTYFTLLYVFYALVILFAVNIGFMTIHRLDSNYEFPIFNHSYINAISPDQNVSQTMYTNITKIVKFNPNEVEINDDIIIYSDFGIEEYFVERVTAIDYENEIISTTYDEVTIVNTRFEDVLGTYDKTSNIIGTIYYTAKFNIGFLMMTTAHVLLPAIYYYSVLDGRGYRKNEE